MTSGGNKEKQQMTINPEAGSGPKHILKNSLKLSHHYYRFHSNEIRAFYWKTDMFQSDATPFCSKINFEIYHLTEHTLLIKSILMFENNPHIRAYV